MKKVDLVDLTKNAIAQTMGAQYMESLGNFGALDSYKLADVGKTVTSENTISSLTSNLVSVIGKHVIDTRLYHTNLPSLYVESFDWGGYLQRTRYGLGDIMDDPMFNLVKGKDYSEIEHTYYMPDIHSKIYEEAKPIMTPISIHKETLKEAFLSWDKLNVFISGLLASIQNTINIALMVYEKMILSCAIAISDKKTNSAIHLISEAVNYGIIEKINVGTESQPKLRNPTYEEVRHNEKFLLYCAERIGDTRTYFSEPSKAFNDGSVVTWSENTKLILLKDFDSKIKFNLRRQTFNPEDIGFGKYDVIPSWQGIKDASHNNFNPYITSAVALSADATNKLGIGKTTYGKSGVVALMFDEKAIGISLMRTKVTSSYTACADFWNEFHHQLVNYLIDSSYGIVAFICD